MPGFVTMLQSDNWNGEITKNLLAAEMLLILLNPDGIRLEINTSSAFQ